MEESGDVINRPETPEDQECSKTKPSQTQGHAKTSIFESEALHPVPKGIGPGQILPPHHRAKFPSTGKNGQDSEDRRVFNLIWNGMQDTQENHPNFGVDQDGVIGPSPRYFYIMSYTNLGLLTGKLVLPL